LRNTGLGFTRRSIAFVIASLALAATSPVWCASGVDRSSAASPAALVDVRGPADLRARFNLDTGKIRVVLLVSPT
jgi:hypothetical protein